MGDYRLSDRYLANEGTVLLTGVQALARLPIEQLRRDQAAGLHTAAFLSGYPGSPLGGLDMEIERARKLVPELPIVHQPAVNEELGATSVMGSQLAPGRPDASYEGVVGFWYGKAPGLDRAGDALRHGVFAGASAKGGAVVLVGDDPASKSSTMPSSSDATLVDLHMPILYPGSVAECLELGIHAVAMSRASGLWSSMKIVTPIADGSATITLPALGSEPIIPTLDVDGVRWECSPSAQFLGPRMLAVEQEFREIRLPLAHRYGVENRLNRIAVNPNDAWIGLVATGFTYYEMVDALRRLGFEDDAAIGAAGIRLLQLRMPVPFDSGLVKQFAAGLAEIVVVEEKNATLESLIKDALYRSADQPLVVGKTHEDGRTLMRSWGRLDADAMLGGLRERLAARLDSRLAPLASDPTARQLIPLTVNRTPYFCSGCPHNWGTKVPPDALVGAGTGCHGMTLLMDSGRVGESIGITAMGNEGAQWIGMEPFIGTDHLFQNYGDGTYFHSAQLALQYCIGAGKNITFKILYNGTVAMTGGQDATFSMSVPDLVTTLLAQGVARVAITTEDVDRYKSVDLPQGVQVHDRNAIVAVQAELQGVAGVTVLIHDQFCAAELRRSRRRGSLKMPTRRVVINHRICEGCGDCGDVSNCLSVQPISTPFGRKTTIDQASCNFDYSCIEGDCPAFMSVDSAVDSGASAPRHPDFTSAIVPSPAAPGTRSQIRIRMAGIGGTGVVTVAQILATAAMSDGWHVGGLDQTGLSQKAGPVISDVVLTKGVRQSSNLVGNAQADLILGFDALVAASPNSIDAAKPDTVVVASSHRTPTGRMVTQPGIEYPVDQIENRLNAATHAEHNRFVDATALSLSLTGSASHANVLLLGVAVQGGHVGVSTDAIESAIELNGVAVEANLAAFDQGRRWAHDSEAVESLVGDGVAADSVHNTGTVPELPSGLAEELSAISASPRLTETMQMLADDLMDFQDERYAQNYIDALVTAAGKERRIDAASEQLTESVARSLHKLMAYKDEYEVARLMLLPEAEQAAEAVGGPDALVTWHLHPPMLKALGMKSKIGFGPRSKPLIQALRAAKRLRGTRLDPFARSEMRRTERALVGEFRDSMDVVYAGLTIDNLDEAAAIAQLPMGIRGFEELKVRRIGEYRDQLRERLIGFRPISQQ